MTTKAALEAHTVNLAAERRGTGVAVNAYRPGDVATARQTWIRGQDPGRIGAGLHERFTKNFADEPRERRWRWSRAPPPPAAAESGFT